jgi:hypothetical protein
MVSRQQLGRAFWPCRHFLDDSHDLTIRAGVCQSQCAHTSQEGALLIDGAIFAHLLDAAEQVRSCRCAFTAGILCRGGCIDASSEALGRPTWD